MQTISEYLDHALQFERLANFEEDPEVRADLQNQASAYRGLAADRAKALGLTHLSVLNQKND